MVILMIKGNPPGRQVAGFYRAAGGDRPTGSVLQALMLAVGAAEDEAAFPGLGCADPRTGYAEGGADRAPGDGSDAARLGLARGRVACRCPTSDLERMLPTALHVTVCTHGTGVRLTVEEVSRFGVS